MVLQVALVNMPFAALELPSIGLSQLRAVAQQRLGTAVEIEVVHATHVFARIIGRDFYREITGGQHYTTGLGDWIFGQAAFPDAQDNTTAYLRRHYRHRSPAATEFREAVLATRDRVPELLGELARRYGLADRDVVGFTSMFSQNVACFALARSLKEAPRPPVTVMGGANCEAAMGRAIVGAVEQIDAVFSGPALVTFPRFLEALLDEGPAARPVIPGVYFSGNPSTEPDTRWAAVTLRQSTPGVPLPPEIDCHSSGDEDIGADLDINATPDVDYEDFFRSLDEHLGGELSDIGIPFETSRGCWWGERMHCTFCGLNGSTMTYRALEPDRAVAHLNALFARYGSRCTRFAAVDNILPMSYFDDVLPRVSAPPATSIFYEVKANLTDDQVHRLALAGVREIQPGIESLATSTLRLMQKGSNVFTNIKLLKSCVRWGIRPEWNLLVGFPGEDESSYKAYTKAFDRLHHLPPPCGVYPVRFDRFSPYWQRPDEFGLKLVPYDFYSLVYPFDESVLGDLAYFFYDANFSASYAETAIQWLPTLTELIGRWRQRWADGHPPAVAVEETADGVEILDGRLPGAPTRLAVPWAATRVLDRLDEPTRLARLSVEGMAAADTSAGLDWLDENKLVFREGDLVLGLVVRPATVGAGPSR